MNNLFLKNLTAIAKKNPELAKKLQSFIPTDLPQLVQTNNAYNLLYKGKHIHNSINPLAEANEIFAQAENTPVAIHVIYGLGLGYLFQIASLKSQGCVILFEPDLNILWVALTLVDFSNDILKPNIYIASTFDEVAGYIYQKSGIKNKPTLLSLSSQREFDSEQFKTLVRKLQETVGSFSLDLKFTQQKFYASLKMLLMNLPNLFKELPLARFKNAYDGKTAVIVSAGPTLDRNIETLKKYRDKYILFTVGTAVKTLYANGIKPDFLCIIETYNSSRQLEELDLSDVNFITEPYSNPQLRKFKFKNIFSHISSNNPINQFWSNLCEENTQEYLSKGTVSYTALNSARILGCNKIILVGQDLAYIEGQCYSKDSVYKDLYCEYNQETNKWEIVAKDFEKFSLGLAPAATPEIREQTANKRLKNLNASLYYVKGIKGDMLPTESVYATFINPLQEYTKLYKDIKYINTSLIGAQIDGFENMPLEEALKDLESITNIELDTAVSYEPHVVLEKLKNQLVELKKFNSEIEEGKRLSKNLNNEIKRSKTVNKNILKSLKKISLNYLTLTKDYANQSKLFEFIITSDKIDLDYEMKMLKDFNFENISNINEKLSSFYNNIEARISEIEGLINEGINTES